METEKSLIDELPVVGAEGSGQGDISKCCTSKLKNNDGYHLSSTGRRAILLKGIEWLERDLAAESDPDQWALLKIKLNKLQRELNSL